MLTCIARASVRRVLAPGLQAAGRVPAAQLAAPRAAAPFYLPAAALRSFHIALAARQPTTTDRGAAAPKKKKAAAKKAKAKPKPKPKPKKRVKKEKTPEEKAKEDIRALKAKALLDEPKLKPQTAWLVYTTEGLKGVTGGLGSATAKLKELAQSYKNLSSFEAQRLQTRAEENKLANMGVYKAWVESHSAAAVHEANQARSRLRRVYKQPRRQIVDERQPRRNVGAYMFYVKERYASGDFVGERGPEAAKAIAREWRGLSDAQKQTYFSQAKDDLDRYAREAKRVLNLTIARKE